MTLDAATVEPAASHGVPYRIVTERVVTRCYAAADAEALHAVLATDHVRLREWLEWAWDEPQELDTRRNLLTHFRHQFEAGADFTMGMFDRSTGQFLGGTGLHPRGVADTLEIGYWLTAEAEGRGLMREVAGALAGVALGLRLAQRVEVRCDPRNVRSRKVPEALGFRLDGVQLQPEGTHCAGKLMEVWSLDSDSIAESTVAGVVRPGIFDADGAVMSWAS